MKIEIALCLPRDAETVALVRSVAMAALERVGVTADCIDEIRLALSEACTNVIRHADTEHDYEVRLDVDDEECSITVTDAGAVFDPADPAQMPEPTATGGRGMALMAALSDTTRFENQPEVGTIVHLVKRLTLAPDGPLTRLRKRD